MPVCVVEQGALQNGGGRGETCGGIELAMIVTHRRRFAFPVVLSGPQCEGCCRGVVFDFDAQFWAN